MVVIKNDMIIWLYVLCILAAGAARLHGMHQHVLYRVSIRVLLRRRRRISILPLNNLKLSNETECSNNGCTHDTEKKSTLDCIAIYGQCPFSSAEFSESTYVKSTHRVGTIGYVVVAAASC